MAEHKNGEKREYVRADLTTQVRIKLISRQEFERHKAMQPDGISNSIRTDEGAVPNAQLTHLTQRLIKIEEKLDRVLRKLAPGSLPEETATYGTAQNVSGAGVNLILKDRLDLGQLILISLEVPGFSIGFLQAYGEVVRVSPSGDKGQQLFNTSIKFLIINETEREKLISYAFRRQRQEIRGFARDKEKELENQGNEQ